MPLACDISAAEKGQGEAAARRRVRYSVGLLRREVVACSYTVNRTFSCATRLMPRVGIVAAEATAVATAVAMAEARLKESMSR